MNILYLLYFDIEKTEFLGVKKKILNQIEAMKDLGNQVDLAYCKKNELIIDSNSLKAIYQIKPGFTHYRESILKVLKKVLFKKKYDLIYIRFPGSIDYSMYKTFKFLNSQEAKVLLELPTYPIGGELQGRLNKYKKNKKYLNFIFYSFVYSVHLFFSRKIYRYVHKIVTFMPYNKIWGVPTIIIDNGVNIKEYKPLEKKLISTDSVYLIGVANVALWHGFDRVIAGIVKYYENSNSKREVFFNIVGESRITHELKKEVKRVGMEKYVTFSGALQGEQLQAEYQKADIAISSLGMHRINVLHGSTLKSKEYCAYGIPFVLAYHEKEISEDFPYALQMSSDDSPILIESILEFHHNIKNQGNYQQDMHDFAKLKFDWKIQMSKVLSGNL